jgi:hypothetical protein
MEPLLEALIDAEIDENGHYLPMLGKLFEMAIIQEIETDAKITEVNRATASRLLFIIWGDTRRHTRLYDQYPSSFLEEKDCTVYVDEHPDIIPLLVQVHRKKAYSWLFSNRM